MITRLSISRFESIRELQMDCRKVNVLIGAPDTGKTNILEALHFLSRLGWNLPLDASLRLSQQQGFDALFYRQFFDQPFEIAGDAFRVTAMVAGPGIRHLNVAISNYGSADVPFAHQFNVPGFQDLRYYSFADAGQWAYRTDFHWEPRSLRLRHGQNLMYIARHNERVYDFLKELVAELDWKLRFDSGSKRFVLSEVRKDDIIDYNLELLSDSIKRYFFFGAILLTSKNAVLIFDEPDVQAFPPYPKQLGRMIAEDDRQPVLLDHAQSLPFERVGRKDGQAEPRNFRLPSGS